MLLLKPQFIPKQKSIVDNFFETDNIFNTKFTLFITIFLTYNLVKLKLKIFVIFLF